MKLACVTVGGTNNEVVGQFWNSKLHYFASSLIYSLIKNYKLPIHWKNGRKWVNVGFHDSLMPTSGGWGSFIELVASYSPISLISVLDWIRSLVRVIFRISTTNGKLSPRRPRNDQIERSPIERSPPTWKEASCIQTDLSLEDAKKRIKTDI